MHSYSVKGLPPPSTGYVKSKPKKKGKKPPSTGHQSQQIRSERYDFKVNNSVFYEIYHLVPNSPSKRNLFKSPIDLLLRANLVNLPTPPINKYRENVFKIINRAAVIFL